ncbi:MAG: hypothetical protein ACR2NR_08690 [Solirubrobacteraceae bacterium]
MELPRLDWSAAEVSDGTLTVKLSGDADGGWEATFSRTLVLLSSGGSWGSVGFDTGTVTVDDVHEGDEKRLRFALDAAVQEANAHHAQGDDDDEASAAADDDDDGDAGDGTDRRMTDRFRD